MVKFHFALNHYTITTLGQILAAITALFRIGLVVTSTGIKSMDFIEELTKKNRMIKIKLSIVLIAEKTNRNKFLFYI